MIQNIATSPIFNRISDLPRTAASPAPAGQSQDQDTVQLNGSTQPTASSEESRVASTAAPLSAPRVQTPTPTPAPAANAPASLFMADEAQASYTGGGPILDVNDPQYGIRCSSFLRPDPLLSHKTQMVVHCAKTGNNPGGIAEMPYGNVQIVSTEQLLSSDKEVLLGFGQPKVFTVVPKEGQGKGYQKLDAAPFFRRDARIASAETVQSGVFIRPKNLPPQALEDLRNLMIEATKHRGLSSARANAKLLNAAGFTSGGKKLKNTFPYRLFVRIAEHGLEYKGQPVKFDILSTTPLSLDEHFRQVIKHEIGSPVHPGSNDTPTDPSTPPTDPTSPTNPTTDPPPVNNGPKVMIRNSRPGFMGSALRSLIGAHIMWEAVPDKGKVNIDDFLPETLMDKFHDDKPLTTGEKIKSVLFTPAKVAFIRRNMAKAFDEAGAFAPQQIAEMLRIPGEGEEAQPDDKGRIMYNIVIAGDKGARGNRVVIARLKVEDKDTKTDDVLSKHVLISGYDTDVRFAGEMWAERYTKADGTEAVRININNNSGTYRPTAAQADAAGKYLEQVFPGVEIVAHGVTPDIKPPGKPDYLHTYPVAPEQLASVRSMDGKTVTLHDSKGGSQDFKIRKFGTMEFDTEFFDTPGREMLNKGGMLRARTRYKKPGSDRVKAIDIEAKMAPKDATQVYQNRVKGGSFKSVEAWRDKQTSIMAPKSHDGAVEAARLVTGNEEPFQSVACKNSMRELFFASPTTPIIGRFKPSFVISLDTNKMRESGGPRPAADAPAGDSYNVLTPEIFTKLPWTKKVTPERVEQLEDLSKQLSGDYNLTENRQSAYTEAMQHMAPKAN